MSSDVIVREAIDQGRIIHVTVLGDGMAPEYIQGDVVLVDTAYIDPRGGGVFAFRGLGDTVCRCDHRNKGIMFIRTNKAYDDDIYSHDEYLEHVIGRVVGYVRTRLIPDMDNLPVALQRFGDRRTS